MQPKASVLLIIALVIYSVSGLPAPSERIIGGALANSGQFPYVASVTENDRHICGGFIYSARWVVTTASCVTGKTASKLKIVAGQVSLAQTDPSEQVISVTSIYIVDQYNSTYQQNDIALLKLTADIVFDVNVDFVYYNEEDTRLTGQVAGWGATFDGGVESVNLRYGVVDITQVTSTEPCGEYVYNTDFKPATMICAKSSTTDPVPDDAGNACHFDEGSPLIQVNAATMEHKVVGIMSKTGVCSLETPSVYTRVSVFYSWFSSTAGAQPTRP